jgi:TonB family protein
MSGFGKTLAGSVILHAALIAAAALLYASGAGRVFITPIYTVDLVAPGPVPDPKAPAAEPEKIEPAPPDAAPKTEPKAEPKPETQKVSPESLKVKEKPSVDDALKKIEKKVERRKDEALVSSSIEELKKKMEADRKSRDERVSKLRDEISSRATPKPAQTAPAAPKAPAVAPRNPAGGAARASLESKYPAYYGLLRDKVQENWIYPQGLKDATVSVIVSIKIARSGKLLDVAVEKSSGDKAFDESLLKAVKKAAPFPPLPVDMEGSYLETGLRFCPGCTL